MGVTLPEAGRKLINSTIDKLLLDGHKPLAIAMQLGVPATNVYTRRKNIERELGRKIEARWRRPHAGSGVAVPLFERLQADDDG